ncbi:UNVERIFIED_CONTAM: hypothetical protein K2H54_023686 [Gekko kuhli]
MSRPASSQEYSRRRKHHLDNQAWGAGEEAWASPPSPRRSRWERPGPAEWGPEEPPAETEAGPGPPAPWDRKHPPQASWRGRPRNRPAGQPWDRPGYSQKSWGSPSREGGGSLDRPPRTQRMPRPGGGRWISPEKTGGGRRRTPSPGQGAWDSAEALSRHQGPNGDTRAWGSPGREGAWERSRNLERRAREERPGSPGGAGGRWAAAGRREEENQSPSREHRSLGSSGRDIRQESRGSTSGWNQPSREQVAGSSNETEGRWGRTERRGRERHSPTRKQSGWGSPKREARQEHSGSTRHHAREQGQVNPDEAGSRRSSAWYRERNYQNRSRDEGNSDSPNKERQSPNGEVRGQGSPMRYQGAENLDGGGAEGDSHEREGEEEKKTYAAGSGNPEVSAFLTDLISGSPAVPKEWTPCESVVHWWTQCQSNLQHKMREQLMSLCPRPTLPDKSSETPRINPDILSLLNKRQEKELRSATYVSLLLQDEVLDMLAPAMTIYEMAEEAMEKDEPVDPMELREWSRHLIRFIGSINNRLTFKHRSEVLSCINPRLKSVVSKMSGQSTEGMLFAEDKVKLLKEIIMRFPQLTEIQKMPRKRFYPFTRVVYDRQAPRRPLLRSRPKPLGTGKRGTADQRVEQSQGAGGQGPAKWH